MGFYVVRTLPLGTALLHGAGQVALWQPAQAPHAVHSDVTQSAQHDPSTAVSVG